MTTIVTRKPIAQALAAFRRSYTALLTDAARRIGGEVVALAGADGIIQRREAERIAARASDILRALFVDARGRAVLPDGMPASPYARLLLSACAWVTMAQVEKQGAWMRANVPEDIQHWLLNTQKPVREMTPPRRVQLSIVGEIAVSITDGRRVTARNPLAQYDPPHTWVDPNGYTLNERIWRADADTRAKLNAMLREQIANGNSAANIARKVEQFLVPGRAALRTDKPYGTDASYYSMRLARTEIAHANNSAALAAGRMNPFVDRVEWKRSGSGDPDCPICPQFVGVYPLASAPTPPAHPHCMCFLVSLVSASPDAVADMLRSEMRAGAIPATSPMAAQSFTRQILGDALWQVLLGAAAYLGLR